MTPGTFRHSCGTETAYNPEKTTSRASCHAFCRRLTSKRAASRPAARSHSPCRLVTRQRGGSAARRRPRCAASAGERSPADMYPAL